MRWLQAGCLQGRAQICNASGAIGQKTEMKTKYKISAEDVDLEMKLVGSHTEHR